MFQKVNSEEQLIMLYLKNNKDQNTNICYLQFSGKLAKMSLKGVIRTKRKFGKCVYYTGKNKEQKRKKLINKKKLYSK